MKLAWLAAIFLSTPAFASESLPVPLARTNPNVTLFPESSLADFSRLLHAPAGKYGFLKANGKGQFAWPNGKRVRFWGVNISSRSVWVEDETIERVADVLARAGCNLVRFEAIDSAGGILEVAGSGNTRSLNPERLARLDRWTHELRRRGIYYYFDLLDFRTFLPGDEVSEPQSLGRAARPASLFDRRLIELQKEYASQLLLHRNPYTGLRYVDDPALALVEICNEHGFFARLEQTDNLAEPHHETLRRLWNEWLQRRYGTNERLRAAWGKLAGGDVLRSSEDLSARLVSLPLFSASGLSLDTRAARARVADGRRFLLDVQRNYVREMKDHLCDLGLKVSVTAVFSAEAADDFALAGAEADFTSHNAFFDHPAFDSEHWKGNPYFDDRNPLRSTHPWQPGAMLASLRWEGKPVVLREWSTVWPNRFRATAVPEVAAYASLHDADGVILFGYRVDPNPEALSDFDHQADPTVWGLFGIGAQAFLGSAVAPSRTTSVVRHRGAMGDSTALSQSRSLGWTSRVENRLAASAAPAKPPDRSPGPARLVSSTGQIVRDTSFGMLRIVAPSFEAISGELPLRRRVRLGAVSVSTATPVGAILALSLDGRPLESSKRLIVKAVSRASNTGQRLVLAGPGSPKRYRLESTGSAPIRTFGMASGQPTSVWIGERLILSVGQTDGTWELLMDGRQASFTTDTPGVRARILGRLVTPRASEVVTLQVGPSSRRVAGRSEPK